MAVKGEVMRREKMKKIIILLMMLLMIGSVNADQAIEGDVGDIYNEEGRTLSFWQRLGLFTTVDYDGQSYECSSRVNTRLMVNGQQIWKSTSGKVCYTNSNAFPVIMQIFNANPRTGQVRGDIKIMPNTQGCNYNLVVGKEYNGDIYYCNKQTNFGAQCIDVDGGLDFYQGDCAGLVDGTYKCDSCSNGVVTEYYCDSSLTNIKSTQESCPNGCYSSSRCAKTGEQSIDSDSGDGTTTGTIITCYRCLDDGTQKTEEYKTSECPSGTFLTQQTCVPQKVNLIQEKNPTFKIIKDYEVQITFYLKNTGSAMDKEWLFEIQPDAKPAPEGIMSVFGFGQEACDPDHPENTHILFKLGAGESKAITFNLKIPRDQVTSDGNSYIFPIITEGCFNKNYHLPYLDGKQGGMVYVGEDGKEHNEQMPVLLSHKQVCCFKQGTFNKEKPENYQCEVDDCENVVHPDPITPDDKYSGFCPDECLPSRETIEAIELSKIKEADKITQQKQFIEHGCRVSIECKEGTCLTLEKIGKKIEQENFKDDVTSITSVDRNGMCAIDDLEEEETPDFCSWAPNWQGFGQCGSAGVIILIVILVFFAVISMMQPKGK